MEACDVIEQGLQAWSPHFGQGTSGQLRFSMQAPSWKGKGTAEEVKALKEVGATVVDRPEELGPALKRVFG
jgi:hypothetical protein